MSVHVLVPGDWTVQRGHGLVERLERDLRAAVQHATVFTHLEPREDPASFADTELDRRHHHAPSLNELRSRAPQVLRSHILRVP